MNKKLIKVFVETQKGTTQQFHDWGWNTNKYKHNSKEQHQEDVSPGDSMSVASSRGEVYSQELLLNIIRALIHIITVREGTTGSAV